jgi:hypothetical protein
MSSVFQEDTKLSSMDPVTRILRIGTGCWTAWTSYRKRKNTMTITVEHLLEQAKVLTPAEWIDYVKKNCPYLLDVTIVHLVDLVYRDLASPVSEAPEESNVKA